MTHMEEKRVHTEYCFEDQDEDGRIILDAS